MLLALALVAAYFATSFTPCHQCGTLTFKSGHRVYENFEGDGELLWFCPRCNHIGKARYGYGD